MTIYDELKKYCQKVGVDPNGTHNIKDLVRRLSASVDGNSNGAGIADAVKNLTDATEAPTP